MSHFFSIYRPTTVAAASRNAMGIMERTVSIRSIFHILPTAMITSIAASASISTPQPKHS